MSLESIVRIRTKRKKCFEIFAGGGPRNVKEEHIHDKSVLAPYGTRVTFSR